MNYITLYHWTYIYIYSPRRLLQLTSWIQRSFRSPSLAPQEHSSCSPRRGLLNRLAFFVSTSSGCDTQHSDWSTLSSIPFPPHPPHPSSITPLPLTHPAFWGAVELFDFPCFCQQWWWDTSHNNWSTNLSWPLPPASAMRGLLNCLALLVSIGSGGDTRTHK